MENYSDICLIILLIYLCNFRCNSCEIKAKAPCIFPFIYKNKTYDSCTKEGSESDEFWCATKVNDTGHYPEENDYYWAKCKDFCAFENISDESESCDPIVEVPCTFPFKYKGNTYYKLPKAEMLSGKYARAWVSMVLYYKLKLKY